jgi:type IV pilus assembly protein PilN
MIRINLLPVRAKKKRNTSIYQIVAMSAVLMVAAVTAFTVHSVYQAKVDERASKIADNETEIKRLQKIIGEVNELDKQKTRLLSQLAVIDKLEKGKRGPVRVLDELSNAIPKRVWITSFREAGGMLAITGSAMDNSDISEFMRALQKTPYFKQDVSLRFSNADQRDGVPVYNFEINCKVDYSA